MRRLLVLVALSTVALAFLALVLFNSRGLGFEFASTAKAKTPVVLIVYDELNTVSLMDATEEVDAIRYPNFASLARNSTWYRSATTVNHFTMNAVLAILTGEIPEASKLSARADSPKSLLTLLRKSHRMKIFDPLLFCPDAVCTALSPLTEETGDIDNSLVLDTYLRPLLSEPHAADTESKEIEACWLGACDFADSVSAGERPTLHYLHEVLPHVPYKTLPSGRRYNVIDPDLATVNRRANARWLDDGAALQTEQRYLLQVGYTDRALGVVLNRLRETGIYDKALIVVTADHGCSHRAGGDQRRLPTSSNLDDIAFVPLFVKLPGQTKGRIDDAFVRSIDIAPTIARVLEIPVSRHVDGQSLVGHSLPRNGTVTVQGKAKGVSASLSKLRAKRSRTLAQQVANYGSGSFARVYRVGPHHELIGRSASPFLIRSNDGIEAKLSNPSRAELDAVDPGAEIVPVYFQGTIGGKHGKELQLAIALNGKIQAVTRTYLQAGATRFAAIVPERALRRGRNTVAVFLLSEDERNVKIERLRLSGSR